MVSNHSYNSFKDPELFKRQPFGFLVLAIIFIIVIVAQPEIMLFSIALIYTFSGPIIGVFKYAQRGSQKNGHGEKHDSSSEGNGAEFEEKN